MDLAAPLSPIMAPNMAPVNMVRKYFWMNPAIPSMYAPLMPEAISRPLVTRTRMDTMGATMTAGMPL